MSNLQTITLELLRPGPSHNQLLSPLTQYLALCDGRGAATLTLPFEHREVLRQREALSYKVEAPQREAQLAQTAEDVGTKVLGAIPTLNAALAGTQYGQNTLLHLRLVLSAAELSLLPFELATAPLGFPGEGKPLVLQSIAPLTMTREVRGATVSRASWSREVKILVITAAPPGFERPPIDDHLLALGRALGPWVPAARSGGLGKVLTVLPQASVQSIREACAANDFTHVHILAHGARAQDGGDYYGLALVDSSGKKVDVVSGSRLAPALRTQQKNGGGFGSPSVVTLATCQSGDVGSVIFPGASLAHGLHEAGLPWVIASQFPLSMEGSILMADMLYTGLLRGDDPRIVLHHLRQCLRSECSSTHDWASIVAYAAVPHDFAEQVRESRQQQSQRAINLAFERADDLLASYLIGSAPDEAKRKALHENIQKELRDLDQQLDLLKKSIPEGLDHEQRRQKAGILARHGATEKRRAHILYREEQEEQAATGAWQEAAKRARGHYLSAAKLELNKHWPLTQYLALGAFMGEPITPRFRDYWTVARIAAELELNDDDAETRAYANASLAELYLLERLWNDAADLHLARLHARDLVRIAGVDTFAVASTRRQIERYLDWGAIKDNPALVAAARDLIADLTTDNA